MNIKKIIKYLAIIISIFIIAFLSLEFLTYIGYKCPWKYYLNITCAGCGVTRMIKSIIQFKIYNAFLYNPLFFIIIIITIIYLIYVFISMLLKRNYYKPSINILYLFSIIALLFMIIRNIPGSFLYDIMPK